MLSKKKKWLCLLAFISLQPTTFAVDLCAAALARIGKIEESAHALHPESQAPGINSKFDSALDGLVFSDPEVAAFLAQFKGLTEKRESVKSLMPPGSETDGQKLLTAIELAQFARADAENAKATGARLKVPVISGEGKHYSGKQAYTNMATFLSNFVLSLHGTEVQVESLKKIFDLSFDHPKEREYIEDFLASAELKSESGLNDFMEVPLTTIAQEAFNRTKP